MSNLSDLEHYLFEATRTFENRVIFRFILFLFVGMVTHERERTWMGRDTRGKGHEGGGTCEGRDRRGKEHRKNRLWNPNSILIFANTLINAIQCTVVPLINTIQCTVLIVAGSPRRVSTAFLECTR